MMGSISLPSLNYSSIWMEEITHVTQKGSKPFTLTNTNKLIRGYEGCVGLKTGSTSKAKYCVSAVAKKNDLTMLAVERRRTPADGKDSIT